MHWNEINIYFVIVKVYLIYKLFILEIPSLVWLVLQMHDLSDPHKARSQT